MGVVEFDLPIDHQSYAYTGKVELDNKSSKLRFRAAVIPGAAAGGTDGVDIIISGIDEKQQPELYRNLKEDIIISVIDLRRERSS